MSELKVHGLSMNEYFQQVFYPEIKAAVRRHIPAQEVVRMAKLAVERSKHQDTFDPVIILRELLDEWESQEAHHGL